MMIRCFVLAERKEEVASKLGTEAKYSEMAEAPAVSALDGDRIRAFVKCVSKVFAAAHREILDTAKLCSTMAETGFEEHEIDSGFQTMEYWSQIILFDDTLFSVCFLRMRLQQQLRHQQQHEFQRGNGCSHEPAGSGHKQLLHQDSLDGHR